MPDNAIKCPRCGSSQVHAGSKGFGLGKAAAGGILLGPVGLLGGFLGSKKIIITCLNCGHKWQAGRQPIISNNPKSFERTENPLSASKEPSRNEKLKILKKYLDEGKITKEQFDNAKSEL